MAKSALYAAMLSTLALTTPASGQKVIYFDGTPSSSADAVPGRYICVFKSTIARNDVRGVATRVAQKHEGQVDHVYTNALKGFSLNISDTAVALLIKNSPEIAYCEQDRIARIPDPVSDAAKGKPGGGTGTPPLQVVDWGVQRVGGPGDGAGTGKTVWVIDSGVDLNHPDLNVDVIRSRSFLSRDSSPDDANGHGTHVAGIIAAKNNDIGTVGVAAGAKVVSLRVLDRRGSGSDAGVILAIDHAYANATPGDVANLSLITSYMQSMNEAVQNLGAKGVHVVSAAGNSGADASNYSPASANGANVYTSSAISDAQGTWATYSNYGAPVDYAEPGSSIYSTNNDGGYTYKSGTSMAAPHLSGILLLGPVRAGGMVTGDPDGQIDSVGTR